MKSHIFHFSLGPVQSFIAESRRSRDVWAGSFLLSWLTGHAMLAAERCGAEIQFPSVYDEFYLNLKKSLTDPSKALPGWNGSLPNHFRATVPEGFDPNKCIHAVSQNWHKLSEAVWTNFLADVTDGQPSHRTIWESQIGSDTHSPFWDFIWTMGKDPEDRSDLAWLDQRKMTRLPKQPFKGNGTYCTLISDLPALSHDKTFWSNVQMNISKVLYGPNIKSQLELRSDEFLSPIALVRRLFPALPPELRAIIFKWPDEIDRNQLSPLLRVWPSTAHIAASSWIKSVHDIGLSEHLSNFQQEIKKVSRASGVAEQNCQLASIQSVKGSEIDARLLYLSSESDLEAEIPGASSSFSHLKTLRDQLSKNSGSTLPSPYYAIIAADGDKMGEHVRSDDHNTMPKKLASFASQARKIFSENGGMTVYTGGDDVLGFASIETAGKIAVQLRSTWQEKVMNNTLGPTISIAISFTHIKRHLRWSIASAQSLLNDIAKERMQRNSLAVSIQKRSYSDTVWAANWNRDRTSIETFAALPEPNLLSSKAPNALTYTLTRKIPWAWKSYSENSTSKYVGQKLSTDAFAGMIAGAADISQEDGRLLSDFSRHKLPALEPEQNADFQPWSADALAVLRFIKEHSIRIPQLETTEV